MEIIKHITHTELKQWAQELGFQDYIAESVGADPITLLALAADVSDKVRAGDAQ